MAGTTTARPGRDRRRSDPGPPSPARRGGRLGRLPWPGWLVGLLALAVATTGFGVWALYGSDWLRVERVSVHWGGTPHRLTEDQVLRAAGVRTGEPMVSLDKGAVGERLLDRLPRLDSVQVVRGWPHGVTLKVRERRAEVLLPGADGFIEVDDQGVLFGEVADRPAGVPLLELELEESATLRRFGEDRIRRSAVSVAVALPEALRRDTRVIRVTSYDSISLELSGDRTVRWGSAEGSEAKAEALTALMNAEGDVLEDARHFDVRVPSAPAVSSG